MSTRRIALWSLVFVYVFSLALPAGARSEGELALAPGALSEPAGNGADGDALQLLGINSEPVVANEETGDPSGQAACSCCANLRQLMAGGVQDLPADHPTRSGLESSADKSTEQKKYGGRRVDIPEGQDPGLVDWLKAFDRRHSDFDGNLTWTFNSGPRTADVNRVYNAAKDETDTIRRLRSMMTTTRDCYRNDPKKVCRHHAMLFYRAAEKLGHSVKFRCSGLTSSEHCFNHVEIDGRWFVIDAFNDIWYELK